VSGGLPPYVADALDNKEKLVSYIPRSDLTACKRIILAMAPVFLSFLVLVPFVLDNPTLQALSGATGVAAFIFAIRLCGTSYVISERRLIRFVGEKKIEDIVFAESAKPVLLDFSASDFFIWRWMARFLSLGPVVEARRIKPAPWTVVTFFTSRDPSRMRIGYPGHSLAIAKIFEDVTSAWASAQDTPEAAP
jgi:hypothetical protein